MYIIPQRMSEMRAQTIDGKVIRSDKTIRLGRVIHGLGTITRTFNHGDPINGPYGKKEEYIVPDRSMCAGCHDDFYNRTGARNGLGCWSFDSAVVCNKVGYSSIHVANGPDTKMVHTLSCWHGVSK